MITKNNDLRVNLIADHLQFRQGIDKAVQRIERMDAETKKRSASMSASFKQVATVAGSIFAGGVALHYANQVRKIADEYSNIRARLNLVADDARDLTTIQEGLYRISQETGTSYAANADAYAKIAYGLREVGAESGEILEISNLVNKSLVISGSSAQMAASFMLQFSQAMGSGVLQGDEFRSMMESNSVFAAQLAKALDTDIAGLRNMSKEGKLTSDVLRKAFPKMAEEINEQFAKIPPTTERAMQSLKNAFYRILDDSNQAGQGTAGVAAAIEDLAQVVEDNREQIVGQLSGFISAIPPVISGINSIGSTIVDLYKTSRGFGGPDVLEWGVIGALLLKGKPGAAGLFAALSRVVEAVQVYREMREAQQMAAESALKAEAAEARYQDRLSRASAAAGVVLTSWREVQQAYQDGLIDYDQATDTYTKGAGVRREAHRSVAQAARESADEQKQVTAEVTQEMTEQYRKYVEEVKKLQDQISGRSLSLIEELRAMGRTGMSGLSAWNDLKKEAQEYEAAARKAAEAGDFKEAVEFADKARGLYVQLNKEVKDGDRVLVGQNEALKTSMDGVKRSGELAIEALREQKQAAEEAAKKLDLDAGGKLSKAVEDVADGVKEVAEAGIDMGDTLVDQINRFGVAAAREFDEFERWLKMPHKMLIEREYVEKRAAGGPIGFNRGGKLPGFGGGDIVPALLEPGEWVIRKEAVARFGAGLFASLNSLQLPDFSKYAARFAAGGQVSAPAAGGTGEVITFRVELGGARFGPFTGQRADATSMLRAFQLARESSS